MNAAGRCSASPAFDNAARTAGSRRMLKGFAFGPREAGLPTGFFIFCNFPCIFAHYLYASNCLISNIGKNINMAALKVKEFTGLQRIAPETIERSEMEQALRSAQYALDLQLLDLRNEFVHRESKLRQDYLDRVAEITAA